MKLQTLFFMLNFVELIMIYLCINHIYNIKEEFHTLENRISILRMSHLSLYDVIYEMENNPNEYEQRIKAKLSKRYNIYDRNGPNGPTGTCGE